MLLTAKGRADDDEPELEPEGAAAEAEAEPLAEPDELLEPPGDVEDGEEPAAVLVGAGVAEATYQRAG
jgi:hypothetical protein